MAWSPAGDSSVQCEVTVRQLLQVRNLSDKPERCRHIFPSADVAAGAVRGEMDSRSVVT